MGYDPNEPRDKRGRWTTVGGALKTTAKIVGGAALTVAGAAAVGIAAGAISAVGKDHIRREVVKTVAGKTLGGHATRLLKIPPTHSASARAGANATIAKMSTQVRRHSNALKSQISSQHRAQATGPKIRMK